MGKASEGQGVVFVGFVGRKVGSDRGAREQPLGGGVGEGGEGRLDGRLEGVIGYSE